jgi:hypothetical protein
MPISIGFGATRISKLWLATARTRKEPCLIDPVFTGVLAANENFVKELFAAYLVLWKLSFFTFARHQSH